MEVIQNARSGAPLNARDSGTPPRGGLRAPHPKPKTDEKSIVVSNHGREFNREKKQKPIKKLGRTKDVKVDNARN